MGKETQDSVVTTERPAAPITLDVAIGQSDFCEHVVESQAAADEFIAGMVAAAARSRNPCHGHFQVRIKRGGAVIHHVAITVTGPAGGKDG